MKIILSKYAGFCFGVKRAYNMVQKKCKDKSNFYILGSLAHHPTVEKDLNKWGIKIIKDIDKLKKDDTLIITAHGISPIIKNKILGKNIKIIDTTCPKVLFVHKLVNKYYKKDYQIIIYGDKNHKEVIGINGNCDNNAEIFQNNKELLNCLKIIKNNKIFLVSQTTQNKDNYQKFISYLRTYSSKQSLLFEFADTICSTTAQRQPEIKKLAKKADAIIILGGKESANTKKLAEIAGNINKRTYLFETLNTKNKKRLSDELKNCKTVSIASGASTPKKEINSLIKFLQLL